MTELLTAAQMRAIEAAAIASGKVTGLELMERAGRGVVAAIFEEWPDLQATSHRAVVLCGPGNNGGDGFVVARLLKEWGWEVEVFLHGNPDRLPPDARVNHDRWQRMGQVRPTASLDHDTNLSTALVVDALFGTGISRNLDAAAQGALSILTEASNAVRHPPRVVAIDIASGFDADSGQCLENQTHPGTYPHYFPALTVTFERAKRGHYLDPLASRSTGEFGRNGRLVVVPLGLERFVEPIVTDEPCVDLVDLRGWQRLDLFKSMADHKYAHGHALILSGPSGRGGAARLAARGALRIGAGVVTVGCPPEAIPENAARLDAVMLRGVADAAALAETLQDHRINALCLGPGMGTGPREAGLLAVALGLSAGSPPPPSPPHEGEGGRSGPRAAHVNQALPLPLVGRAARPVVLDADALTILAQHPDLFAALHHGCILTPHAGEFARLFPDIAAKLAAPATKGPAFSKVDATREAAARAGCVVLYKGPDTVIADPKGRTAINSAHYDRAAPWLATAGSGDVLAGFITGLLARGFSPFDAASAGAWLHVECARSFGPGLIAEDLPEELPKVFRSLGL
jgi:hydroxyethylthiazole kinase-like uncharacterized protein yjeF